MRAGLALANRMLGLIAKAGRIGRRRSTDAPDTGQVEGDDELDSIGSPAGWVKREPLPYVEANKGSPAAQLQVVCKDASSTK